MEKVKPAESVDEYISRFPDDVRMRLDELRKVIRRTAPDAIEKISYGMPAYDLNGLLIYFAGYANHVSIYPFPSAMEQFKKEAESYRTSKGTIQFKNSEKIPLDLVSEIVKFRAGENNLKAELKKSAPRKKKKS